MTDLLTSTALSTHRSFGGGLRLHKINHISPSSTALFVMSPATWILERLLGRKTPVGCAAHRGSAAEAGIVYGLQNFEASIEEAQAEALRVYDRLTALSPDPRRQKERDALPGIVATGIAEFRQYGQPSGYQGKVMHEVEGLPPILGYWDAEWEQHQLIVDFKTTLRVPSEISSSHARQVATYIHNTNKQARVGYIGPAKLGVYVLERPRTHFEALVNIARRMDRFLSISADPWELASLVVPDMDHFTLNDPLAQANAREVFGFTETAQAAASSPSTPEATAA